LSPERTERTIDAVGKGGDMQGFTATWQDGVLRLSGELDLATDEDLLIAFRSVSDDGSEVILDLSELEFIDSTGIRAFVTIAKEASPRRVVLRSPQRAVRKVINLTRLEGAPGVRVDDAPVRSATQ
jgi:anti-sigma B factor antagonist